MEQYIYEADLYCSACIRHIKARLRNEGREPEHPEFESSYDSNEWPKGPYKDQEADGPEYCAACGIFLENPLTAEGYTYLKKLVAANPRNDRSEELMDFYPEAWR